MKMMNTLIAVAIFALTLSACGTQATSGNSDVQIDSVSGQSQSQALFGHFWGWATGTGSSSDAPDVLDRPSDREQVICSWWCPSGYSRRDVTVGPTCSWYHIGKCVDRTSYTGESCGFAAKKCVSGLSCVEATEEEAERNAHPEACH